LSNTTFAVKDEIGMQITKKTVEKAANDFANRDGIGRQGIRWGKSAGEPPIARGTRRTAEIVTIVVLGFVREIGR
jgi:hypothetical protein